MKLSGKLDNILVHSLLTKVLAGLLSFIRFSCNDFRSLNSQSERFSITTASAPIQHAESAEKKTSLCIGLFITY